MITLLEYLFHWAFTIIIILHTHVRQTMCTFIPKVKYWDTGSIHGVQASLQTYDTAHIFSFLGFEFLSSLFSVFH